jgi:glycosyltransferase 2 family protein
MPRPHLVRWIRLGVSAGVVAVLFAFVPFDSVVRAIGRVPARTLFWALVLFLTGHVAAAAKWRWLQGDDPGVPVLAMLRAHFSGVLANLWLPSVVGGDVVRAGLVFRKASRPALVAVASLVDRVIDSAGLVLLAAAGMAIVGASPDGATELLAAAAAMAAAGGVAVVCAYRFLRKRSRSGRVRQILDAVDFVVSRPWHAAGALVASVAIQATFIAINVSLGRAVGVTAPFAAWLMAWPLAKLAALLPISVAGFGVREAALVALLRPFGDSNDAILAAGILWQAVFVSGGALGWAALTLVPAAAPVPAGERLQVPGKS